MSDTIKYVIIDKQTGAKISGEYADRNRARRRVDKLDRIYGGYRYYVKEIY